MKKPLPLSVIIVSCLFLLLGFSALVEMVTSLLNTGQTVFNIVVLNLLIGVGLLRRSNVSRIAALIMIWVGGVIVTVIIGFLLLSPSRIFMNGQVLQSNPPIAVAVFLALWACFIAVSVWVYRVLTNPEIKPLFDKTLVS